MLCPTPVRVSGAVLFEAPTPHVQWSGITRELASFKPECCCEVCKSCDRPPLDRYVRVSTSVVAVTRESDTPLLALPMQAPPMARLPPTSILVAGSAGPPVVPAQTLQRFVPYIKARAYACQPVQRPIFFDLGQSLVLPWHEGAIAIDVAPDSSTQAWVLDPADGSELPMPGGAATHTFYDVWIWATARCTRCCPEGSFAVLTDSADAIAGGASAIFPVPPGAYEATVFLTAAGIDTTGFLVQGTSVVSQFEFASAAFASRFPHTFGVAPGVSQLIVTAVGGTQPVTVAWKVRA